jgi:hypothetical protein
VILTGKSRSIRRKTCPSATLSNKIITSSKLTAIEPWPTWREAGDLASVGFVPCVSFGNMCTCIYCVLYCLYFVFFVLFGLCICFLTCFVCTATE